jgi:hypothetical protein
MNWQRPRRRLAAIGPLLLSLAALPAGAASEPLHVALLIDTSGSIRKPDQALRNSLAAELARSLPSGGDVAVYSFDDQPRLLVARTKSIEEVEQAVANLGAAGRFTALNDAIFDAARYLGDGPPGKRAIVILSDGLDENSALVPEDGVNEAREQRIPIFTVGIGNVQERYLRRIAKLSGGEYFPPRSDAATIVGRVAELTPAGAPRRPAPAPLTAALPGASAAAAARPAAAPAGSPAQTWQFLLGVAVAVAIAVSTVGFLLLRRAAPSPALAGGGAAPSGGLEPEAEPEDVTLVSRIQDLQAEGQTLVLTLKPLLHVTRGPNVGKFFEVHLDSATSIGRAQGNDIVLDDRAVSSQHVRIRPMGGVYELIDMKSTNGTFVNERKVARTNLSAGDVVKVGETAMQFRMDHMKG